ncbi:MAG TPA: glycosyltransferase family 4 protein [Candidatus Limnocylindrales bacterium]|nr:glycosyltransferase family 4 protein [Candidatus Limnocylindrales bacterium]
MKILYHHRTQAEDAQGIHIAEIIKAFRNLGHEVEEVSLVKIKSKEVQAPNLKLPMSRRSDFWSFLTRFSPKALYEAMEIAYNLIGYQKLSQAIQKFQPDFIYERYALYTFAGVLAAKRYGIPIILEVNAPLAYEQKVYGKLIFPKLAESLERWITSHTTKTVVVSTPLKKHLTGLGVPASHLEVIPNGIDPEQIHPGISGEGVRKKYHLAGKVVLGFIGWFRKWHGLEMLLEVMAEDSFKQTPVHLLLIGEGPAYDSLQKYVKVHALSDRVTFTGPIPHQQVAAYMAAMDVALQPSATPYASPMKLFEYMGMGKAIVAPKQENIEEILIHNESGILFEPSNKKALEEAILKCVQDASFRRRIGSRAREQIFERKYLWKENAKKVIQLVQKAI